MLAKMQSKRLRVVYNLIPNTDAFYDLCCDHGQLGIEVLKNKDVKHVYFNDVVESICIGLINKLKASYITNAYSILNCACENIEFKKESTISIVGVGYHTIIRLLENIANNQTLIISSHTKTLELRHFLNNGHYRLLEERLVEENGHIYEVLKIDTYHKEQINLIGNYPKNSIFKSFLEKNYHFYEPKVTYGNHSLSKDILNMINDKQKEFS